MEIIESNCIRFAISQLNFSLGDFEYNKNKILENINKAKAKGVDVLIFSEYSISGNSPKDLLLREEFLRKNEEILNDIVEKTSDITVLLGGIEPCECGGVYNTTFVISDNEIVARYDKQFLQGNGIYDENAYFHSGDKNLVLKIKKNNKFLNCLVSMGEDVFFIEDDKANLFDELDCIINLLTMSYYVGDIEDQKNMFKDLLNFEKKDIFILNSNSFGSQDSLIFSGESFIMDSKFDIIKSAKKFEEDFLCFDIEAKNSEFVQKDYTDICEIIVKNKEKEKIQIEESKKNDFEKVEEIAEIYNALIFCLKEFFHKNNLNKAIVGLSGGIDSALVATLAVEAIGKENVFCLSMPTVYSSSGTKNDSKIMAENLGVNFTEVPIENLKNNFVDIFNSNSIFDKKVSTIADLAVENIQARIRGNLLMSLANRIGGVVLATGNKSEVATGYCTLYGDTVGGFAIIQDLYKTKVFELAKFINRKSNKELIPESIINRKPSAELRENQTDQDSLPEYEILDKILELYIDENESIENIKDKLQYYENIEETIRKVLYLIKSTEYKRAQAVMGLKITKRSFWSDRKVPVCNKFIEL